MIFLGIFLGFMIAFFMEERKLSKKVRQFVFDMHEYIAKRDELINAYLKKDVIHISTMYADACLIDSFLYKEYIQTKYEYIYYSHSSKKSSEKLSKLQARLISRAEELKKKEDKNRDAIYRYKVMLYKYTALLEAFPNIEKYVDGLDVLKKLDSYANMRLDTKYYQIKSRIDEEKKLIQKEKESIQRIVAESALGKTKWLSTLIADYYSAADGSLIEKYKRKKHPILPCKAKELYDVVKGNLRELRIKNKELEYLVAYYKEFYPELEQTSPSSIFEDFKEEDIDCQFITEEAYYKLSKEEYSKLEPAEKNQLQLDRYWKKRKEKWVIGRDYERYIGYIYERSGYKVYYQGAIKKLEDNGIDLIAENGDSIILIQCKYYRKDFKVRENAVNQLYGTSTKFKIDKEEGYRRSLKSIQYDMFSSNGIKKIKMLLITSSILSDEAVEFANKLGVRYKENVPLERYPIIKCNVSPDGKKIYHLPFDQQYDTTKIERPGEFYAMTVREAEDRGFRHAYRWHGEK